MNNIDSQQALGGPNLIGVSHSLAAAGQGEGSLIGNPTDEEVRAAWQV
jgi:hypothetical protein